MVSCLSTTVSSRCRERAKLPYTCDKVKIHLSSLNQGPTRLQITYTPTVGLSEEHDSASCNGVSFHAWKNCCI